MKESSQFNVFHQFAGCFIPHGLLSTKNFSAGAKICYAVLAQQANSRGTTQLNLPLLVASIGESERIVVRYLSSWRSPVLSNLLGGMSTRRTCVSPSHVIRG